jgi:Fe-S-cluster containining protein
VIVAYDLLEKPHTSCRFFNEDKHCQIYKTKPTACKGYPISLYPHPAQSEITLTISSDCPSGPDLYDRVMIKHEPVVFPIAHLWDIQDALCERVLIADTYQQVYEKFEYIVHKPMGLLEYYTRAIVHRAGASKISLRRIYNEMEEKLKQLALSPRMTTTLNQFFKLTPDQTGFTVRSQTLQAQARPIQYKDVKPMPIQGGAKT